MKLMENVTQVFSDVDPWTAFITHDWASVGGWSLFVGLGLMIIIGAFKGWWVPGWMYRSQQTTLDKAMDQNKTLLISSEIVSHFFKSTTPPKPKRGDDSVQEKAESSN